MDTSCHNFVNKFEIILTLLQYLRNTIIVYEELTITTYNTSSNLKTLTSIRDKVVKLYNSYNCIIIDEADDKVREETYINTITAGNFSTNLTILCNDISNFYNKLNDNKFAKFAGIYKSDSKVLYGINDESHKNAVYNKPIKDAISALISNINKIDTNIDVKISRSNICNYCKSEMKENINSGELICSLCGLVIIIVGTLVDNNSIVRPPASKSKRYRNDGHLLKWIYNILCKEDIILNTNDIKKIDAQAVRSYTFRGILRSMDKMKCREVRKWLRAENLVHLNQCASSVRKTITGLHGNPVIPPQLTDVEINKILLYFNNGVAIMPFILSDKVLLKTIGKTKVSSIFYYPYIFTKIICHVLVGDPRLPLLIDCVHLQEVDTLFKNDTIWMRMCPYLNIEYSATDRSFLM